MEGIQHRGGKGQRETDGPVKAVGAHPCRTKVKLRKACLMGEPVASGEARYPLVQPGSEDGMGVKSGSLTRGDLSGSGRPGSGSWANHR